MSINRVGLIFTTSLLALGVAALALEQSGLYNESLDVLGYDKTAPQAVMSYDALSGSNSGYSSDSASYSLSRENTPRSYQQFAQYSGSPSYSAGSSAPLPSTGPSAGPSAGANPDLIGGPLGRAIPANVQNDLSGGPLGAPMPAGTGPVGGSPVGSLVGGGGTYFAPHYDAQPKLLNLPDSNYTGSSYTGSSYTGSSYTGGGAYSNSPQTYSTGSDQPAPSGFSGANGSNRATQQAYNGQAYPIPSYEGLQPIYPSDYPSGFSANSQTAQSGQYQAGQYQGGPNSGPNNTQVPAKRSFWDKIGLGNILFRGSGHARLGTAVVERDNGNDIDTDDDTFEGAADILLRGEASAVTQGGLEYGVALKLRGQYDRYHRGFAGPTNIFNIGDCPPTVAGCASTLVNGTARSVRGATSRLFTSGDEDNQGFEVELEGAHLFLRGAYGDITLGRDNGAAALFSLDTPSTLPLARSSNLRVDYTGLDMTKTLNDASGFAGKVTYISPRLLGDNIGFGVQLGASYAPSTDVCGVDYCVEDNDLADINSPLSAELEDAIEFGIAIDRTFGNGLSAELVANYATASDESGLDVFDDLSAFGLGLNLAYGPLEFGANYLNSNNGWNDSAAGDGDYTAYDVGLTYSLGQWGVTGSYGESDDDLIGVDGRSALLGLSYEFHDFTFGGGVQYSDRSVPVFNGTDVSRVDQDGTALFLEGGFTF